MRAFVNDDEYNTSGLSNVRYVPRLGSEHAQEGVGIHRPCADLGVVGLGNQASMRCPEVLKFEDNFLEGRFWHL